MENVIADYILKSSDERVLINDFVQGDPLLEENLDRTLEFVSNLRIVNHANQCKSILIYSAYQWNQIFNDGVYLTRDCAGWKRREIVKKCDVMIDSLRDTQSKRGGSTNQLINVEKSMIKGKIVLWD